MGRQQGFSLLEVLVAFVILAISMVVIYQSAGGSVQGVIKDERQSYALVLAQSVLDNYRGVPKGGLSRSGQLENGFSWRFVAEPRPSDDDDKNPGWPLYNVRVIVSWSSGRGQVELHSVLPEMPPGSSS